MANHNPKYLIHKKHGFTLVELSIVLVIIGLLISGILIGQSLIESAKINRLVSELRQYEIAVTQFYGKFKQYPGDSSYFSPPGNADGDNQDDLGCDGALSGNEYTQAWAHLSQAGMLTKSYAAYSPSGTGACPGGIHSDAYRNYGGILTPYTDIPSAAVAGIGGNKYLIDVYKNSTNTNLYFWFFVGGIQSLALESKMNGQSDDFSYTQIGLINPSGKGNCYMGADCLDPTSFSNLGYILTPL